MAFSYSFHLSSKSHAVSTIGKVSQVSRHNLRDYKSSTYDRSLIEILHGSDTSILDDVKAIYHEEFDEDLERYNHGKRADRQIGDYLQHVSESRSDCACEIIIQIGDKDFWDGKTLGEKRQMGYIFRDQIRTLEKLVPELRIASAIVHYDEASPHMHVVGVPVAGGYKKGLEKQVAKTKVFTADRLGHLQDRMRENAERGMRLPQNQNLFAEMELKQKQRGRNKDIPKKSLTEFHQLESQIEALDKVGSKMLASPPGIRSVEIPDGLFRKRKITAVEGYSPEEVGMVFQRADIGDDIKKSLEKAQSLLVQNQKKVDSAMATLAGEEERRRELDRYEAKIREKNAWLVAENDKLRNEYIAYRQGWTDEHGDRHKSLDELRQEVGKEKAELSVLRNQKTESAATLKDLSEQVDAKLSVLDDELTPQDLKRMLDDSIVFNLVRNTMLETCKQLHEQGLLTVEPMAAFDKLRIDHIIRQFKDLAADFVKKVKDHITEIAAKKLSRRKGR